MALELGATHVVNSRETDPVELLACTLFFKCGTNDESFSGRHILTSSTPCVDYWDAQKLSQGELNRLLRRAGKDHVAFSAASFSGTPVQTIRAAIEENAGIVAPFTLSKEAAGLVAPC